LLTKNQIIIEINSDKSYINYCKQVLPIGDTYNDLFQYVLLYLLEMDENKLIKLHSDGGLRMYIVRIIYINGKSLRSEFNKQYIDKIVYSEMYDYENSNENLICEIENEVEKEILLCNEKNIYPASAKLLQIYAECGSYQEVSIRTKIPYKTVRRHIISLRKKIIKNINDKNSTCYTI
jgi:hypothetical protein